MNLMLDINPDLTKKTALVTGSTSGIGWSIAQALAGAGANVMVHGLGDRDDREPLRLTLSGSAKGKIACHGADLAEPGEVEALVRDTKATLGPIDILVNNAGLQHVASVDSMPLERWSVINQVVLQAAFLTTKAVISGMRTRGWGRVINIVSAHGLVASPYKSAYVAAKHGLIGLTRSSALELAESGVTVNAICPGYVRTPLVDSQIKAQAESHHMSADRVVREVILSVQPNKRFVPPNEIAALLLFLCSDFATSITGSAIAIDGGWTAR